MEDAVFLCNLTGGINIQADCLRQTALFYEVALFYSLDIQNAHKDKMRPTLHRKKVLVFCVGCGKIISGFEV